MTRKQMRLMLIMIPMLAGGAFAVNVDAIMNWFGSSSSNTKPNTVTAKATPLQKPEEEVEEKNKTKEPEKPVEEKGPKISSSEVPVKTVAEGHLTPLGAYTGEYRNPFAPPEQSASIGESNNDNWVLPPDVTAQVIYIGKTKKIACIEGHRLQEGDRFQGGKVISIEPNRVTVEMPNHVRWAIPLAASLKLGGRNP